METHVGSDVLRVLNFFCSSLGLARVSSSHLGMGYKQDKLSVFQIHYVYKVYHF